MSNVHVEKGQLIFGAFSGWRSILGTYLSSRGLSQCQKKITPLVITCIAKRKAIHLCGGGLNICDGFLAKNQCTDLETLVLKGEAGETYRVGDDERTNLELADLLCDLVDERLKRRQGTGRKLKTFVQDRAGHDRRYFTRIQNQLEWRDMVGFLGGLMKTADRYFHCYK